MVNTVYVLERDPAEREWIESALAAQGRALVFLGSVDELLGRLPAKAGDSLVCSTEPDEVAALELVRSLRQQGERLPVVMIGPHSAFRTAVDVARFEATHFLERPVSTQRLRAALRRVMSTPVVGAIR
jgi:DNA-binding NtrC family response regulator